MGWGGRRAGAGAKPRKKPVIGGLPAHVLRFGVGPTSPVDVPAPDGLTEGERAVWQRQAPAAVEAGTLTPRSALSFARYVRLAALESEMAMSPEARGGANHRGLVLRLVDLERQFGLAPTGAPAAAVQAANPLDRFLARR